MSVFQILDPTIEPALVAISGGLGDIGTAMAEAFLRAGARVALGDLASSAPKDFPADVFYHQLDVSAPASVERWFDSVFKQFGACPNVILPTAAVVTTKPHLEVGAGEWRREIDINLNGGFYFADSGCRRMVADGIGGRVVFIGSWAGHAPHRKMPAYSVSKAGLRMLMRTLALEHASRGILVNEIAPGYVDAGLSGRIFDDKPSLRATAQKCVPTRELISTAEVAGLAVFLCSSAASQITGTILLQDGGLSLLQGPQME